MRNAQYLGFAGAGFGAGLAMALPINPLGCFVPGAAVPTRCAAVP
jgi:hypothetical protein